MLGSDAVILLAALGAAHHETPVSLKRLIYMVDYLNRVILTFEETEGALARLTAAGYLTFSNGMLSPTETSLEFYRGIPRAGFLEGLKSIKEFIGAEDGPIDPRLANIGVSFPALSRAEFEAAVAENSAEMQAAIEKLMKQELPDTKSPEIDSLMRRLTKWPSKKG
jgi:hypothetical protein